MLRRDLRIVVEFVRVRVVVVLISVVFVAVKFVAVEFVGLVEIEFVQVVGLVERVIAKRFVERFECFAIAIVVSLVGEFGVERVDFAIVGIVGECVERFRHVVAIVAERVEFVRRE